MENGLLLYRAAGTGVASFNSKCIRFFRILLNYMYNKMSLKLKKNCWYYVSIDDAITEIEIDISMCSNLQWTAFAPFIPRTSRQAKRDAETMCNPTSSRACWCQRCRPEINVDAVQVSLHITFACTIPSRRWYHSQWPRCICLWCRITTYPRQLPTYHIVAVSCPLFRGLSRLRHIGDDFVCYMISCSPFLSETGCNLRARISFKVGNIEIVVKSEV